MTESFDLQCQRVVEQLGHEFIDDPCGTAQRRTCKRCGRAILRAWGASHVYGSANVIACDGES